MDRWEEIYGSRHGTRSSSWKCCNRCDITVVVAGGRKQMDAVLATLSSDEAFHVETLNNNYYDLICACDFQ